MLKFLAADLTENQQPIVSENTAENEQKEESESMISPIIAENCPELFYSDAFDNLKDQAIFIT
jgi:hypothetical protein